MSEKPRRAVLSSRINPRTGEREFYEMTPEEAEAAIRQFIKNLPEPKPVKPEDIDAEAERGANNARLILASNPTQERIQEEYEWTFEDAALGDDSPLDV
jgi:hypothetical protein